MRKDCVELQINIYRQHFYKYGNKEKYKVD